MNDYQFISEKTGILVMVCKSEYENFIKEDLWDLQLYSEIIQIGKWKSSSSRELKFNSNLGVKYVGKIKHKGVQFACFRDDDHNTKLIVYHVFKIVEVENFRELILYNLLENTIQIYKPIFKLKEK